MHDRADPEPWRPGRVSKDCNLNSRVSQMGLKVFQDERGSWVVVVVEEQDQLSPGDEHAQVLGRRDPRVLDPLIEERKSAPELFASLSGRVARAVVDDDNL